MRVSRQPRRQIRRRGLAVLMLLSALSTPLVLAACGGEQPAAPSGSPSITGTVRAATAGTDGVTMRAFLAEGSGDYDKAQVTVTDKTAWYQRLAGTVTPLRGVPAAATFVGTRVEVQFTGAVAESYPVQATARWVILEE